MSNNCGDPNCVACTFPPTALYAISNLVSSVFMTVLTIDQQTHRHDEIFNCVQDDLENYLIEHRDNFKTPAGIENAMSEFAIYLKGEVEKASGYHV